MAIPYEIVPGSRVWFGSAAPTHDPALLRPFTHVVNCESSFTSSSRAAQMRHFLFLKSYDEESFPILDTHFSTLLRYIREALADKPSNTVYIHCYAGQNRSATLAIAYACHLTNRPAAPLIAEVRKATSRHVVENEGFYQQLATWWPAPTPSPESSAAAQSAAP
jgi:protein-tyrosine phosphatase